MHIHEVQMGASAGSTLAIWPTDWSLMLTRVTGLTFLCCVWGIEPVLVLLIICKNVWKCSVACDWQHVDSLHKAHNRKRTINWPNICHIIGKICSISVSTSEDLLYEESKIIIYISAHTMHTLTYLHDTILTGLPTTESSVSEGRTSNFSSSVISYKIRERQIEIAPSFPI